MRMLTSALVVALATACSAERPAAEADNASAPAATAPDAPEPAPAEPGPVAPGPAAPEADPTPGTGGIVAERFQGRYAADAAACGQATHETRLTIEPTRISFYESSGPITDVRQGEDELSITAQLTGEGETREANYSFRLSDDGSTLVDVGTGMSRQRCI